MVRSASFNGVAGAAVGLGAAELVSATGEGRPSLLVLLGQEVIDRSPQATTDTAIDLFGTADKPLLVIALVVAVLAVGATVGRQAARRRWLPGAVFGAGGLVITAVAMSRQPSSAGILAVAGLIGAGLATFTVDRLTRGDQAHAQETDAQETDAQETDERDPDQESPTDPSRGGRRDFLSLAGSAAGLAVVVGGATRLFRGTSTPAPLPSGLALPPVPGATVAQSTAFADVEGLSPLFTPNDGFFRIDTALSVPRVDVGTWKVRVVGMVDRIVELGYEDLRAMEQVEVPVTLSCVSNEVGGGLVGNAMWQGVWLTDVLDLAGVQPGATQLVGRSVDGWTAGFPTEVLGDGRPALVALGMNGEPLPRVHGFPARLVVSGLYGYVSATKWLSEIELTTLEAFDGYWVPRGWSKIAPVKTQSRIDVPSHAGRVGRGLVTVAGVAWAPSRGISAVEVAVDGGAWQGAELADEVNVHTWRHWRYDWTPPSSGEYTLTVRATDGDGLTQTEERERPRPSGATGHHSVVVYVD